MIDRYSKPEQINYYFDTNFIIREEYFGGLLFSRGGTPAWELDHIHSTFLKTLYYSQDFEFSINLTKKIFGLDSFTPQLSSLLAIGVLKPAVNFKSEKSNDKKSTIEKKIIEELKKSSKRACLKAPTTLTLYCTMHCQQNCSFCFLDSVLKKKKVVSKPEQWVKLIAQAKEIGVTSIAILGGEPTCYPDLDKIIRCADRFDINLALTSNGIHIPKKVIKALCETKNALICLSLQSLTSPIHKNSTGITNTAVLKSIEILRKNKIRFNVNTIGLGQSDDELKAIADYCAKQGAEVWFLNLLYQKHSRSKLHPGLKWYTRTNQMLKEYIKHNYAGKLSYQLFGCQLYWTYTREEIEARAYPTIYNNLLSGCSAGAYNLEILPDGSALPCINLSYPEYCCGNVFEQGLEEVWEKSQILNKIRHSVYLHPNCISCNLKEICRGGCLARRAMPFESKCGMDPLCPIFGSWAEQNN